MMTRRQLKGMTGILNEEHERHESDIFDKAFPLMDILDERFTSQNVFVLPPHRRCA
jgi:hypothetical protein